MNGGAGCERVGRGFLRAARRCRSTPGPSHFESRPESAVALMGVLRRPGNEDPTYKDIGGSGDYPNNREIIRLRHSELLDCQDEVWES